MGVYKRPSGWCWEIKRKPQNRGEKWVTIASGYGYENEDAATEEFLKAKRQIKLGIVRLLFEQACINRMAYIESYATHRSTYADNKRLLGRFREWADLPCEDITIEMIRTKIQALGRRFTNSTANKGLVALRAVFSLAIRDGKLMQNPCRGVEFLPVEHKPKMIPERDQVAKVLLLAKPMDRAYLTVVRFTAARINEINRLTWDDVDFEHGRVRLWTNKKKGGDRKARWVPTIPKVMDALRYAHQHRTKNSPYVFTNPKMVDLHPTNPERWCYIYRDKFFKTLCRQAGVPEMGYHTLRHLTASEMAAKGASLTDIQRVLGHERATTTDIYLQSLGFENVRGAMMLLEDEEEVATSVATQGGME